MGLMTARTYRDFGLVNWHDCGQCPNPETCNNATDHHHGHPRCKCLESTADEKGNGPVQDRSAAP